MDKKTALDLYTLFRQENAIWLQSHREHSQQYFTLVVAILAASIAAITQLSTLEPIQIMLVAIGPGLNWLLCRIAILMCSRSYQAYLEGISIQAKLEPVIGLIEPRNPPTENQSPLPFSKDEFFLPERWLMSRHFATAEKFVEEGMKRGSNQIIKVTFETLGTINFLFAILLAVYALRRILGF